QVSGCSWRLKLTGAALPRSVCISALWKTPGEVEIDMLTPVGETVGAAAVVVTNTLAARCPPYVADSVDRPAVWMPTAEVVVSRTASGWLVSESPTPETSIAGVRLAIGRTIGEAAADGPLMARISIGSRKYSPCVPFSPMTRMWYVPDASAV